MADDNADAWQPALLTDPERAWKIISNHESRVRVHGFNDIRDLLFNEIIRLGYFNHQEMAGPARDLYEYFLDHGLPLETRQEIYREVFGMVENTKIVSVNAFTPFLCLDPDRGIASRAALDYVSMAPMLDDDPMRSSKELIRMIEAGEVRNPGAGCSVDCSSSAIRGSANYCGRSRISFLNEKQMRRRSACQGSSPLRPSTSCSIGWKGSMAPPRMPCSAGSLASHLGLQRRHMQMPFVVTGLRPFPFNGATPEERSAMQQLIPVEEYVNRIAPRLLALAQTEPEPKVMPLILREWGIAAPTLNN